MRRPPVSIALAGLALLALPAAASGATVSVSGDNLRVQAAAGEANVVTVARSGNDYVVTDSGVAPTAGSGCAPGGGGVTCSGASAIRRIDVDLDNLGDTGTISPSVLAPFELQLFVNGGAGNDTLNAGPNAGAVLIGGDDQDVLNGSDRRDALTGADGNDLMNGGAGGDSFRGDDGNDVQNGGPGDDSFDSDSSPDGADIINGGPGLFDAFEYRSRDGPVSVTQNNAPDDGEACPGAGCEGDNVGSDVERIDGGEANDSLIGGPANNDFSGQAGDDSISGGPGADQLSGREGDDVLAGGRGDDDLEGDDGSDRHSGDAGDDVMNDGFGGLDPDVFSGGKGIDLVQFFGDGSQRVDLDGRADDGEACPGAGCEGDNARADVEDLGGGQARDVLIGSRSANELLGGAGADKLVGGAGADGLFGEDGADNLTGGGARDTLGGGSGADRITSRGGAPDQVSCGASVDAVKAGRSDRVGADCERVRRKGR